MISLEVRRVLRAKVFFDSLEISGWWTNQKRDGFGIFLDSLGMIFCEQARRESLEVFSWKA